MQNDKLVRRQLDKRFMRMGSRGLFTRPPSGWIRTIRRSLGMTTTQLAERLGMSRQGVLDIENSELRDAATLKTLQRVASALDCTLVYAIVPNSSLEQIIQEQAHRVATERVRTVDQTMKLEEQGLNDTDRQAQIKELAEELIHRDRRALWRRPA